MLDAARRSGGRSPIHARARARPSTGNGTWPHGATTIASGGGLADRYAAALYAHADEQHALDTVVVARWRRSAA